MSSLYHYAWNNIQTPKLKPPCCHPYSAHQLSFRNFHQNQILHSSATCKFHIGSSLAVHIQITDTWSMAACMFMLETSLPVFYNITIFHDIFWELRTETFTKQFSCVNSVKVSIHIQNSQTNTKVIFLSVCTSAPHHIAYTL